jgi:putative endonuclease
MSNQCVSAHEAPEASQFSSGASAHARGHSALTRSDWTGARLTAANPVPSPRRDHSRMSIGGATVVYCLVSADNTRSYVGVTNNLARRLRQHRGERSGGARATRGPGRDWRLFYTLEGLPDRRTALQFEWRLHRLGRRRAFRDPTATGRRQAQLDVALAFDRVTKTAPRTADLTGLHVVYHG